MTEPKMAFDARGRFYTGKPGALMSMTRQLRKNIMREFGITSGRQWVAWRKSHKQEWTNLQQGNA